VVSPPTDKFLLKYGIILQVGSVILEMLVGLWLRFYKITKIFAGICVDKIWKREW
jgi:hypothetical protein